MLTRGPALLRAWIDAQKHTQRIKTDAEAAQTIGCSPALLCHWLQGTRTPGREWCIKLARATAEAVPVVSWATTPMSLRAAR